MSSKPRHDVLWYGIDSIGWSSLPGMANFRTIGRTFTLDTAIKCKKSIESLGHDCA